MKISLDFDGVLIKRLGIPTVMNLDDEPVEGARDAIIFLMNLGHKVWVLTSNPDLEGVKKWLADNYFPELEVTNIKKPAHVYIDDRALRFTNWQDIRKYFG